MIKSPLRYPGGKTRAIKFIDPLVPLHQEYREPFVGGGSVFAHVKQKLSGKSHWINDLNYDLYLFWKFARDSNKELVQEIRRIKEESSGGRELFERYTNNYENLSGFDRAVRFFILNRITFSGLVDSGGYSEHTKRFTDSSIDRLSKVESLLQNTVITDLDYQELIQADGEDVFVFLDPPYFSTTASKMYGKNGDLHIEFDHERLANAVKDCDHKWLITYDDCEEIRNLFSFANIVPWSLQYGMNNYKQDSLKKGKELFISNYEIKEAFHYKDK